MTQTTAVTAPKRRRRGRGWIIFGVIVVVLVALFFVLDTVARSYASSYIDDKVHSALGIPASQPVDVDVQGVSVLAQLATGKLEHVDISSRNLTVGPVTGDVSVTALGIPLQEGKPVDSVRLGFGVGSAELQALLKPIVAATKLPISKVAVADGEVKLSGTFSVFAFSIPVAVSFVPAADAGELSLTPRSIEISGNTVTATQAKSTLGADLSKPAKICVASLLPKGFVLDSIDAKGDRLALAVTAKKVALGESTFTSKGSC